MLNKKAIRSIVPLTTPSIIVVLVVLILINWRIPTRIELDLTVDRATFQVGGTEPTPILTAGSFRSLTLERFARVEFNVESLAVADPTQYLIKEDRFPETAWKPLDLEPPIVITGKSESLHPALTFEGVDAKSVGTLELVRFSPGAMVTLEVSGQRAVHVMMKAEGQGSTASLAFADPFEVVSDHCRVQGVQDLPAQTDSLTFRAVPLRAHPHIEIQGQPESLVLGLTLATNRASELFARSGIPLTALDFSRQGPDGEPETTLIRGGTIAYPDYPGMEKVAFNRSDFVRMQAIEKFRIREMGVVPVEKAKGAKRFGLHLRMLGWAGVIRTGVPDFTRDHRMTRFDALWHDPSLAVLFVILVWVFTSTVGGYKLYQELSSR